MEAKKKESRELKTMREMLVRLTAPFLKALRRFQKARWSPVNEPKASLGKEEPQGRAEKEDASEVQTTAAAPVPAAMRAVMRPGLCPKTAQGLKRERSKHVQGSLAFGLAD